MHKRKPFKPQLSNSSSIFTVMINVGILISYQYSFQTLLLMTRFKRCNYCSQRFVIFLLFEVVCLMLNSLTKSVIIHHFHWKCYLFDKVNKRKVVQKTMITGNILTIPINQSKTISNILLFKVKILHKVHYKNLNNDSAVHHEIFLSSYY